MAMNQTRLGGSRFREVLGVTLFVNTLASDEAISTFTSPALCCIVRSFSILVGDVRYEGMLWPGCMHTLMVT